MFIFRETIGLTDGVQYVAALKHCMAVRYSACTALYCTVATPHHCIHWPHHCTVQWPHHCTACNMTHIALMLTICWRKFYSHLSFCGRDSNCHGINKQTQTYIVIYIYIYIYTYIYIYI